MSWRRIEFQLIDGCLSERDFYVALIINSDNSSRGEMMDDSQIIAKLREIFEDVFYEDDLVITRDMSAEDIDNWDSLTHVRLVMSVERAFNIRFSAAETGKLKNVGDLIDLIASKLPS